MLWNPQKKQASKEMNASIRTERKRGTAVFPISVGRLSISYRKYTTCRASAEALITPLFGKGSDLVEKCIDAICKLKKKEVI